MIDSSACFEGERQSESGPMGYACVKINGRVFRTHRLIAMLFLGLDMQDSTSIVCHTCDNPRCFNPNHLYVGTQKDNIRDASVRGRMSNGGRIGIKNARAKVSEAQVLDIRSREKFHGINVVLAKEFNLSPTMISAIRRGKNWTHI